MKNNTIHPLHAKPSLVSHTLFLLMTLLLTMLIFSAARWGLYFYNHDLSAGIPRAEIFTSFFTGMRFDLIVTSWISTPLLLGFIWPTSFTVRRMCIIWLSFISSIALLLCISELDFYREFHQRFNNLVFEYAKQDPRTVASMLWNGFPVGRYLLFWAFLSWLVYRCYQWINRAAGALAEKHTVSGRQSSVLARAGMFVAVLLLLAVAARGTLRQGPPLRWGDAFNSSHLFANHLGLNGIFTLVKAANAGHGDTYKKFWRDAMPIEEATAITRQWLLTPQETLVAGVDQALLRQHAGSKTTKTSPSNVVVILMESFSGAFTGALGNDQDITPAFDKLSKQGLLFTRFFSNGTHTHQGMFATLACFPNLPSYEYLMQEPEGTHAFSGLPLLLDKAGYQNVYIYNGSFSWDNQEGFFRNQGMTRFIGRDDFVNPIFNDPTWGVSDQDMFDRAATELATMPKDKPFFAMLQTLSNHVPYALPNPLPVAPVKGKGAYSDHLTAMRYADWALGEFFQKIQHEPYYKNTIFVLLGDHGFGIDQQLTDIDLLRFRVPLLIIAPGIREQFGTKTHRVATQIDVAPTVMGLLGKPFQHQCWGRDVLSLDYEVATKNDPGFGLIKPSGNDEIVGFIHDDHIVVQRPNAQPQLYKYGLQPAQASVYSNEQERDKLAKTLRAYVERATRSLLDNTTGAHAATSKN